MVSLYISLDWLIYFIFVCPQKSHISQPHAINYDEESIDKTKKKVAELAFRLYIDCGNFEIYSHISN